MAPDTSINSGPAQGSTISGSATFSFSSSESKSHFACSVDGGAFAPGSSPRTLKLGDGPHVFAVRAIDGTGNTDATPARRSFKVDSTAPQTKLEKPRKKKTTKKKVKVKFSSSEPDSTFECRVDSKPFEECTSPYKATHLRPGKHKIQVRATDPVGNTDLSPATAKIKVVRKH